MKRNKTKWDYIPPYIYINKKNVLELLLVNRKKMYVDKKYPVKLKLMRTTYLAIKDMLKSAYLDH